MRNIPIKKDGDSLSIEELNSITNEIQGVVEKANITFDANSDTQLIEAVKVLQAPNIWFTEDGSIGNLHLTNNSFKETELKENMVFRFKSKNYNPFTTNYVTVNNIETKLKIVVNKYAELQGIAFIDYIDYYYDAITLIIDNELVLFIESVDITQSVNNIVTLEKTDIENEALLDAPYFNVNGDKRQISRISSQTPFLIIRVNEDISNINTLNIANDFKITLKEGSQDFVTNKLYILEWFGYVDNEDYESSIVDIIEL